jgi:hypothetical protein
MLPFLHTTGYRQSAFIDFQNIYGRGPNAVFCWGGPDRSQSQYLAASLYDYLNLHLEKLKTNYYYNKNGVIQTFPRDPKSQFGGVAITEGVKVEAVAQYIHFFSTFDGTYYPSPKKYFAYQIRVSVE